MGPRSLSESSSQAKTQFSNICNSLHTKTHILTLLVASECLLFGARGVPKGLLPRCYEKDVANLQTLPKKGSQKGTEKLQEGSNFGVETMARNYENECFRMGGVANFVFPKITCFLIFFISANLRDNCCENVFFRKCSNPSQIPGDISHGISRGASRTARHILF